jgi:hypothetical protein
MQALRPLPQGAPTARAGRGYSAIIVLRTLFYGCPRGKPFAIGIFIEYHTCVATRKNITIRDDQEEWVQDNHLNLSRFVQDKLDDLIEDRS